ncbi:MAG: PAS domain S-box protein, partial [Desulfatirhabdiaceae bacterium]|nr:PAS domain S-box protein [Desulfatirhabdiaceae bacterium]
ERNRTEKALRDSEERFRAIATNTPDHILIQDGQLRYTFVVNPQLGLTEQDMLGKTDYDFLSNDEADKLTKVKRQVMEIGEPHHFETPLISIDGDPEFFDGIYVPKFGAQGKIDGLIGYFRNVTERKKAEVALRKSEELFRESFYRAGVGKAQADPATGRFLRVNSAFCEILGYTEAELLQKTFYQITLPEEREADVALYQRLLRREIPTYTREKRYVRKNGTLVWGLLSPTMLFDPDGRAILVSAVIQDISVRKLAEEALRESEREFRSLAEAMPQIVWASRSDGWIIYFNQQWVDYTGLTLEESYGHGWNKPFHPEDQQRAWDAWQRATQHNEEYSLECRLRRHDGTYRWWLIRGVPLIGNSGEILKWFGTYTDIEGMKRAEEELQKHRDNLEALVKERTQELEAAQEALVSIVEDLNEKSVQLAQAMEQAQSADRLKSAFL